MTTATYQGGWVQAPNLSADAIGSIHDDDQARRLGFRSALVGGSVLVPFMTPALVEVFGPDWYERGFLKQSFIQPIYETTDFRVVVEEIEPTEHDERLVRFGLETREGGRATAGYAGLARSAESALAPWDRPGEPASPTPSGPDDPVPDEPIGTAQPPRMIMLPPEISASRRAAAGDTSPWYTESSPWGGRIVPTGSYIVLVWAVSPDSARAEERSEQRIIGSNPAASAGMNGTFQLLQTGPMFADQPYELRSHLAEKGFSGRTAFRTMEHSIYDRDQRRVAAVRQKVRWFPMPAS
jgi:hypothetical protein